MLSVTQAQLTSEAAPAVVSSQRVKVPSSCICQAINLRLPAGVTMAAPCRCSTESGCEPSTCSRHVPRCRLSTVVTAVTTSAEVRLVSVTNVCLPTMDVKIASPPLTEASVDMPDPFCSTANQEVTRT